MADGRSRYGPQITAIDTERYAAIRFALPMLYELYDLFWTSRTTDSFRFDAACALIACAATTLFFWFRKQSDLSPRAVVGIGVLWTLLCALQYWALGTYSFLGLSEELIAGAPWLRYVSHTFEGGTFAHGWSGGIDADTAIILGNQYLAVERILFGLFHFGIALFFMKAGAVALAYWGMYMVAHVGFGLPRLPAVALSLLAGVGSLLNLAFVICGNGWGFALLPLAFYVLALRTRKPHYFAWVAATAVLFSSSTSLVHQLPMTAVGLAIGALLVPGIRLGRFALGSVLFFAIFIANWSGIVAALVQLGPESFRVQSAAGVTKTPVMTFFRTIHAHSDVYIFPLGLFALGVLAWFRDRLFPKALAAYAVAVGIGPWMATFDWSGTHPVLAAYRWDQISYSSYLIVLILTCFAFAHLKRRVGLAALYILCLAVWAAADLKIQDYRRYLGWGGQARLLNTPILRETDWRPKEPFRLVTVGNSLYPNMGNAHGVDTFDGISNSFTSRSSLYFGLAVEKRDRPYNSSWHALDFSAGQSMLGETTNLDALRVANVQFVFSDVALADPELKLISSQKSDTAYYLYELPTPWPRAFIPKNTIVSNHEMGERAFYEQVLREPQIWKAVVSHSDAKQYSIDEKAFDLSLYSLEKLDIVRSGFVVTVARRKPADSKAGVLILNVPFSRFWTAQSQGKQLSLFPVNGVQTGVILKDTGTEITVRYKRH